MTFAAAMKRESDSRDILLHAEEGYDLILYRRYMQPLKPSPTGRKRSEIYGPKRNVVSRDQETKQIIEMNNLCSKATQKRKDE
jgi:hypothetical protein